MKRIQVKPFFFRLLRRVPMPVIAIVVGVAAGIAVWGVLEQIQSRQVKKIFDEELHSRLQLRSRESLILFDQYLADYAASTRMLANHRQLAQYLEPLFWFQDTEVEPVIYRDFRPEWLPDIFKRQALSAPSHALLVDSRGRVREIFQQGEVAVPTEIAEVVGDMLLDASEVRAVLTRFGQQFYLVLSDAVEDSGGYDMGSLVVLVPVNDEFIAASQRGLSSQEVAIALVDSDEQLILVSSDSQTLFPDTPLEQWTDTYLVTSQSLPQYEGSDWNPLLTTFILHDSVDRASRHVRVFERRQRAIAAAVFITAFTLVIYLVSARLNKVLKRMSSFSHRALGIQEPRFQRGANQLILLEEWIQQFTNLVLKAREEMSRKHAIEMRESEALKAAMMEASLDSIITLDRKGEIIEFNPTAERTLGFSRGKVIGASFSKRFVPDGGRKAFLTLLRDSRRARRKGRELRARSELTALRADGSKIPVELSIVPIRLDERLFYTLYMHDITNRRQAEREIRSLARFASESPNPILRVNPEGMIVYANPASRPLLGDWETAEGAELPLQWTMEVREVLEAGCTRERETTLGDQVFSLLFAPIQDLGYVNIYGRDITAVRRAEQESRQHQSELVHVCRLSTMGEVATGMAHELNQPLSAIANYANGCIRRLQSGAGDSGDLVDAMSHINSQAQRASEIIRRLRALVGKQPPVRSLVDLNYLVREVCSFLELETARMELAIELDLATGEIPVDVDLVQIEQVLLNLVRNALDALQEVPPSDRRLTIRTRITADGAEVAVEDTGPGIPSERAQQLFDPFFTTKETGMGMGLPISQTIVENHSGQIWVDSPPGDGALFCVRLPLAETPATPADDGANGERTEAAESDADPGSGDAASSGRSKLQAMGNR